MQSQFLIPAFIIQNVEEKVQIYTLNRLCRLLKNDLPLPNKHIKQIFHTVKEHHVFSSCHSEALRTTVFQKAD